MTNVVKVSKFQSFKVFWVSYPFFIVIAEKQCCTIYFKNLGVGNIFFDDSSAQRLGYILPSHFMD